ncbi:MAG: ATP-binding protein, partial [Halobacteriaceae archaeon]
MNEPAVDVIEVLLTARLYERHSDLDENDIPAWLREPLWSDGGIERPLPVTETIATEATNIDDPWDAISGLMFTDRDSFSNELQLVDEEMAENWLL